MSEITDFLGAAAKGAAAGAVLGPVGALAGAGVGGLVSIGTAIAPEVGRWLGGEQGQEVVQSVAAAVQEVAGTPDPDVATAVLAQDPEKVAELRVKLADIAARREHQKAQDDLAATAAFLASQQDARATTTTLVREGSPLAYGAAVVTLILLALFCYVLVAGTPLSDDLRETLKVLTVSACSYWIGSSRGSAAKDRANADSPKPRD